MAHGQGGLAAGTLSTWCGRCAACPCQRNSRLGAAERVASTSARARRARHLRQRAGQRLPGPSLLRPRAWVRFTLRPGRAQVRGLARSDAVVEERRARLRSDHRPQCLAAHAGPPRSRRHLGDARPRLGYQPGPRPSTGAATRCTPTSAAASARGGGSILDAHPPMRASNASAGPRRLPVIRLRRRGPSIRGTYRCCVPDRV